MNYKAPIPGISSVGQKTDENPFIGDGSIGYRRLCVNGKSLAGYGGGCGSFIGRLILSR